MNDNPTPISVITITDQETTAEILMGNTICIDIPAGVDMTWDTNDVTAVFGGPAFMKVSGPPVYSNGDKRMCVSVIADFLPGEVLTISGLKFDNFNSSSGPASLTVDVDGDMNIDVDATDDKAKAVGEPLISSGSQTFLVYDGVTVADTITLTEDPFTPTLTDADEIRIQIPAGLDMEWDTSNTTPTLSGTFITNGGGIDSVTYPDAKTMLISIDRDFAPLETLIIDDATFANFGVATGMGSGPDNLEIVVSGAGGPVAATDPQDKTVLQPTIETATMIDQSFVVKSTDQAVEPIKITEDLNVATILADNGTGDIRIVIPGALDLTWDTSITLPTFDTTGLVYGGAISPMVSYEDAGKTLVIDVLSDFGNDPGVAADSFTISGLEFENLNSGSPPDSLELEVRNDGVSRDEDPYTKEILTLTISSAANQNIPINSPDQVAETITITDATGFPLIKAGNLYVRIPESLDMEFVDPPAGGVTASGTAVTSGHVAAAPAIVYLNDAMGKKKIACIPVGSDFDSGDTLILAGFELTGFGTVTGPDNLELIIDGNPLGTTVAEDDKFKRTSAAIITSAADQFFLAGTGVTPASLITIIEHPTSASITATDNIVIDIPDPSLTDLDWNNVALGSLTFGGTYSGMVTNIAYSMGDKRLTLLIDSDFMAGETLTVDGLEFNVGANANAPDNLELSVDGGTSVADVDDKRKAIGSPTLTSDSGSEFNVGDPPTVLPTINVIESAGPTITAANDIMIKLPASFNGEFDTTKLAPTFGGSAAGKVAGVSYPDPTTMIVNVTADFSGNDTLTIDDLCLQNFTANSPAGHMELYVEGPADVTVESYDDKYIAIGQMVFVGGSMCYSDAALSNMSTFMNFPIGGELNRILVVGITVYDTDNPADADVTDVTFNGVSMMPGPETGVSGGGVNMRTEIWYMLEASLPAAGMYDLVVTTAGVTDERFLHAVYIYNAKQTGTIPESTATGAQASSSSPFTTAITTMNDGAWIFDVIGTGATTANTEDAAQTEVCDDSLTASSAASYKDLAAAGLTSMSWSMFTTGSPMAHSIAAFAPFVVNVPPTLTDVVNMVIFLENTVNATPQVIDADVTLTDLDSPDFDGGNLTVNYSVGGGAEDQLSFDTSGDFTIAAGVLSYMGTPIGTIPVAGAGSGIDGNSLIVSFNANATPAIVELLIEAMTYANASDTPTTSRTIEITVDDGDGGVSVPVSTVINVAPENDPPTLTMVNTLGPGGFFEDTANQITYATLLAAADENDPDGDTLLFTIESVTTGTLTKGAGMTPVTPGVTTLGPGEFLTWTPPADENNVSEGGAHSAFTVTVTDGTASSAPAVTVPISVTPCNDPPSFLRGPDRIRPAGTAFSGAWATSISVGPADEVTAGQTIASFNISTIITDNPNLFTAPGGVAPSITAAGVLSFTIAPGQAGYARLAVTATDTGANGGCDVNTSAAQEFIISSPVIYRRCGLISASTSGPSWITIGDYRGNDNARDLFIANMTTDSVGIWKGSGVTTFSLDATISLPVGSSPACIALGDYNRDGHDDIAIANFGTDTVVVYSGRPDLSGMTLTDTEALAGGSDPMHMVAGDMNGDGRSDLVTANFGGDSISVLLNLGNSTFGGAMDTSIGAGSAPSAVAVGYFNADANLDVAVAQHDLDRVSFHLGNGSGGFSSSTFFNVGNEPISLTGANDFDGDGHVDVVVANYADDTLMLIRGNGDGTFNAPGVMDTVMVGDGPRHVAARDVDHDGDLDVASANNLDNTVSLVLVGMGAPTVQNWPLSAGPPATAPVQLAFGNFNGPRNGEEIVVANFGNDTFQILCNVLPYALPFPNSTDRSLDVWEDSSVTFDIQGTVLTQRALTYRITRLPNDGSLADSAMAAVVANNPLPGVTLTYTPEPNFFGVDSFTFTVTEPISGQVSAEATVKIYVGARDDKPSMTIDTPSHTAASGAGAQVVANFATNLRKGPDPAMFAAPYDESDQKIQIQHSPHQSYNKDLFAVQPTIDATGTLRYTPREGQSGTTAIKFRIVDNQGIGTVVDADHGPVGNEVTVTFTVTP